MKKSFIVASSLFMALSLTACSQESSNSSTTTEKNEQTQELSQKSISIDDIKNSILTTDLLRAPFSEPMDAKDFHIFTDFTDKIESGFVSQAMMNVKFQDVIVIKTSDVDGAKSILEDYLSSDAVRPFKDGYGGEDNIEAISNAIINNNGDYVYLIATPNSKDIENKLLEVLKK